MTKVKELIKNSTFTKADGFDNLTPEVSIFLPTYKRGDNGLFERALKSILNQNFKNFELIIIDDASIDSTASIYKKYMEKDARIAVIRHEKNIGLAAISEIEAFLKSRGQKILCAFDDNDFTTDGLQALVDDQKNNPNHLITYGLIKLFLSGNDFILLGKQNVAYNDFLSGNKIGHSSVLVDRKVFDTVGYYDPHFAVMRFWDWDLWLRAAKQFFFHRIKTVISSEYGITQPDSLGNTVKCDSVVTSIWMQRYRNLELLHNNILDYEFDTLPKYTGNYFKVTLSDIIKNRFGNKYPMQATLNDDGYILLVAGVNNVSLSLVFDVYTDRVVFVSMQDFEKDFYKYTAGAKAIIFGRDIPYASIINKLDILKKEYYYYSDDNLFIIPEFHSTHGCKAAQDFLSKARGMIASTPLLVDEFKNLFKKEVQLATCTIPHELQSSYFTNVNKFDNLGDSIRIGWCSAGKEDGLITMKEDLIALAKILNKKIEFFCFSWGKSEKKLKNAFHGISEIKFIFNGLDLCYSHLLNQMRDFNPHFLIHTHTNVWADIYKYKTYNYLINAWYLNAIPFITIRPPYDKIKNDEKVGKFIVKDGKEISLLIQQYLKSSKEEISQHLRDVKDFLDATYPIKNNQKVIMDILEQNDVEPLQKFFCLLDESQQQHHETTVASDIISPIKYNIKYLRKVVSKTISYYIKGKPHKYKYPVRYNLTNLSKEFKQVVKYYKKKLFKQKGCN